MNIDDWDENLDNHLWVNERNEPIDVCDMTDQHITNTIQWLKNNNFYRANDWIRIFEKELKYREEKLLDMFEEIK